MDNQTIACSLSQQNYIPLNSNYLLQFFAYTSFSSIKLVSSTAITVLLNGHNAKLVSYCKSSCFPRDKFKDKKITS